MPIRPGIRRLFRLGDNRVVDANREVADEIRLHIELRTTQLMQEGLDAQTARAEATQMFAQNDASVRALYHIARERNEAMRIRERVESWVQDIHYAMRGLAHDRSLALFIIITLALGIGANLTSFSLVDRLLLRPPAQIEKPNELVRLYLRTDKPPAGVQTTAWIPYQMYTALRDNMKMFRDIGAYGVRQTEVGQGADARKMRVGTATGNTLGMLGVKPVRGRIFNSGEDGAITGDVSLISEDIWRSRYAGDPTAIGRSLDVGGVKSTIVGVVPHDFTAGEPKRVDVWMLVNSSRAKSINWRPVGRLKAGATMAAAGAEAQAVHQATAKDAGQPKWASNAVVISAPLRFGDTAAEPPEATMARWLAVVTAMILLITFANIVNLMLVRLTRRRRELAIRVALGSGRARVIRLLAVEGAILAGAGGIASMAVARVVEPIVSQALFAGDAGWTFSFDSRLLVMVFAFVALTALIIGIMPAVQAGSPRLVNALKNSAQSGGSSSTVRNALTVVQATLSVVLLIGASLFLRSMHEVRGVNLGVDPDKVIVATGDVPWLSDFTKAGFDAHEAREVAAYRRIVDAVRRVPGVASAAISVGLPLDGGSFSANVYVAGYDSVPSLPGGGPFAAVVGSDYFTTMGTRIVRGRAFNDTDRENTQPVIIVGEAMSRALWPKGDAIGACVRLLDKTAPCTTVVGVAADVHRVGLTEEPSMQYYLAFGQPAPFGGASVIVRAQPGATISWAALRTTMVQAEPGLASVEIAKLSDSLNGAVRPFQLGELTFGLSGVLALIVAALGLYSLMSYTVAWRTREIGVRMALGASKTGITRLVVLEGTRPACLGIVAGVLITIAGGRWLQPYLFNVRATDPIAMVSVTITLLAVAAIAGWVPARRALRISPTEALRAE